MSSERPAIQDDPESVQGFTADDLARLFNYPSIGELFSDSDSAKLDSFRSRLASTRDQLEKVVRHGSREEADKAGVAIKGIDVTLDFLLSLDQMRISEGAGSGA